MTQAVEWVAYVGAPLHDEDGNVVGTIEEFYVETGDHGCSVNADRRRSQGQADVWNPHRLACWIVNEVTAEPAVRGNPSVRR